MSNTPSYLSTPLSELIEALRAPLIATAQSAGAAIMTVYGEEDFCIDTKSDDSPVTKADVAAHHVIVAALRQLTPDIPILSEESEVASFAVRQQWQRYWLVDPLDGTKEFIHRNGEFTVNIALIDGQRAALGVVYAPVLQHTYWGAPGLGSYRIDEQGEKPLQVTAWKDKNGKDKNWEHNKTHAKTSEQTPTENPVFQLVASRRHGASAIENIMAALATEFGEINTVSVGSSLKLCWVAEGKADLYPRLALTSEWDTAAAQAIVEGAGGGVFELDGRPLEYNTKDSLLNPFFYVVGDKSYNWPAIFAQI